MTDVSLDTIKTALRIDGNDDDILIQSYIETAKSYVASAITGGSGDQITALIPNTKYNMAVVLLVHKLDTLWNIYCLIIPMFLYAVVREC